MLLSIWTMLVIEYMWFVNATNFSRFFDIYMWLFEH